MVLGGEFAVFLFLDCLVLLELELDVIDDSTEIDAAVVFVVVLVFRFLLRKMESGAAVGKGLRMFFFEVLKKSKNNREAKYSEKSNNHKYIELMF